MKRVTVCLGVVVLVLVTGCASGNSRSEPAAGGSLPPPPASVSSMQAPPGDVALIVAEPDGVAYSYVQGSLAAAYLQTGPATVEYTNWLPGGQIEATGTETCVSSQDVRTTMSSPIKGLASLSPLVDKAIPDHYLCSEGITAVKASIDFVDSNFNTGSTTPVDVVYVK